MLENLNYWLIVIFLTVYFVIIIGAVYVVLSENRNPIRALTWVIALIFLPGIGLIFYLFFGRSMKHLHMISRHNKRKLLHSNPTRKLDLDDTGLSADSVQMAKMVNELSHSPLSLNNTLEIFTDGPTKFRELKRDLHNATTSIWLQYYIFLDDDLGSEIADILIEKARAGLDVKVIYDHVGSFSARNRFFKRMSDAGVDVHPFFRVTFPQLANRINWRNHRKIVVIDFEIGYIGGMNIADRYDKGLPDGRVWRDTHFRVTGDVVRSLALSFSIDWSFQKKHSLLPMHFRDLDPHTPGIGMQLITSGPTSSRENIVLAFLRAISSAKKSIYIQTPYFLPTDSLLQALEAAAAARVDVRVMIPCRPDSRLLRYASFSYVTQCLKSGIKVYLYQPGMLHAKAMIIDDEIVTAGSCNFDFRSFENNFEANLFIYDRGINRRMRDIFFADLAESRKLTYTEWHRRPAWQRAIESVTRLFAPIL